MTMPETESVAASSVRMSEDASARPIGSETADRLAREPADAELHVALAQDALREGRRDLAGTRIRRALAIVPVAAPLHANLAILSDGPRARRAIRRALALAPDVFPFHANLSAMPAFSAGQRVRHGWRAMALQAGDPGAILNLALALGEANRANEAAALLAPAVRATPLSVDLHFTLGGVLADLGETGGAWHQLRCAAALAPADAGVWLRMARIASSAAAPLAASDIVSRATSIDPRTPAAWSARLMVSLYDHRTTPVQELGYARSRRQAEQRPIRRRPRPSHCADRIRLAYVSADFWKHPVAYNIAPAIEAHDRRRFQITCYADMGRRDDMTDRLARSADRWVDITGHDDETLAHRIRADGIDVLVVLAGNTARNRLGIASLRPAPVQLSMLDVASSGSPEIDGIVVDPMLCPPSDQAALAERPLNVSCLFCFTKPEGLLPTMRRAEGDGIVFGSFSNPAKIGPATVALWAPLLHDLPGARLLLKYKNLYDDRSVQARIRGEFAAHGVDTAALDFSTRVDSRETHLDAYRDIDIALDPIPFNGCTTTFEALWMGVPVLSRTAGRMMGRMGASILSAAGLPDLVSEDDTAFHEKGRVLAIAGERRRQLRQELRPKLLASRLTDGRPLARELEAVFEEAHRAFAQA